VWPPPPPFQWDHPCDDPDPMPMPGLCRSGIKIPIDLPTRRPPPALGQYFPRGCDVTPDEPAATRRHQNDPATFRPMKLEQGATVLTSGCKGGPIGPTENARTVPPSSPPCLTETRAARSVTCMAVTPVMAAIVPMGRAGRHVASSTPTMS